MEFGVFQGASVGPRPWEVKEPLRIRRDIEVGIAADAAGFDTFWAPEHHCLEEYSHNSSSHLSCLAVGLQTKNIRVVTGIFNLCPTINHPVRVAEQIAMIDILTHGRVELGTGRGSGSTEVNTFGVSNEESREMWEEAIRAIPKMWTQDLFSWDGKHFQVPERCILPKPVQKPHPPLWVTSSNPGTIEVAGRMGLGAAMFNFSDPELLRPLVETYKSAIEKVEPISEVVNNKIMTISPSLCLEDGDEARALYGRGGAEVAAHFSVYFDTIPDFAEKLKDLPRPIPQTKLRELIREAGNDPNLQGPIAAGESSFEFHHQNGICVGSPDEVADTIARFQDVGFDQLVLIPTTTWDCPHEKVLESIRLLGEKVLPRFR
ncbi:MAG: LLM class flavin-dependent oxidoreductase [Deltaproteobacteria bacterium]|nr:LLM class flavin-dependent oxidoreductase [Deltaproteobacteria bacterium]MBW2382232.1 LLM class flavin-dependent oxidoreductase [Deltaproteobacteria bacterium]MBW2696439.1 LLM class flavin-dependent oxidoreductase [Deltaproteobacteria bacterium]